MYLDVDAAGALEIDFNEVGAAGGENPEQLAAAVAVAHLLGEHGVDSSSDAGVAAEARHVSAATRKADLR